MSMSIQCVSIKFNNFFFSKKEIQKEQYTIDKTIMATILAVNLRTSIDHVKINDIKCLKINYK